MTENQEKALKNFKQFVEQDLEGELKESFLRPEYNGAYENKVFLSSIDNLIHVTATYDKGTTQISILLEEEHLDKVIKEFKDYIDSIDDNIFTEACELFKTKKGENALSELDFYLENKSYYKTFSLIRTFIECVSTVAKSKIEGMIIKYFPEYKEFIKNNGFQKIDYPKDINELD